VGPAGKGRREPKTARGISAAAGRLLPAGARPERCETVSGSVPSTTTPVAVPVPGLEIVTVRLASRPIRTGGGWLHSIASAGLVARVVPADQLLDEALKAAAVIAGYSLPVVMMAKESVNRAFESSLTEGLLFERRVFHATFAIEDQKEGMAAFVEKRKPTFKNR